MRQGVAPAAAPATLDGVVEVVRIFVAAATTEQEEQHERVRAVEPLDTAVMIFFMCVCVCAWWKRDG